MRRIRKYIRRTGRTRSTRRYFKKRSFKRKAMKRLNRQVRLYKTIGGEVKTFVLNFTYTGSHSFFYIPFFRGLGQQNASDSNYNIKGYQQFSKTFTTPAMADQAIGMKIQGYKARMMSVQWEYQTFLYSDQPQLNGVTISEQLFVNNPKQFDVSDAATFLSSMTGINFNNTYWPENNKFIIKKKKKDNVFAPQIQNNGASDYSTTVGKWTHTSKGYMKFPQEIEFDNNNLNDGALGIAQNPLEQQLYLGIGTVVTKPTGIESGVDSLTARTVGFIRIKYIDL